MLFLKIFFTILFYTSSFLIAHNIKYGNLELDIKDLKYLGLLLSIIFLTATVTGRFRVKQRDVSFVKNSKNLLKNFVINLGLLALAVNYLGELSTSRFLLTATLSLGFFFELLFIITTSEFSAKSKDSSIFSLSKTILLIEFTLLVWIIIFTLSSESFAQYTVKQKLFFIIMLLVIWFVNGTLNREFDTIEKATFSSILWNHIKSYVIFFLIISALLFLFTIPMELKKVITYNLILFSLWALAAVAIYYIYKAPPRTDTVSFSLFNTTEFPEDFYKTNGITASKETVKHQPPAQTQLLKYQLKEIYLKNFNNVYEFLDGQLDLEEFDISKCSIIRSADMYNIEVLPDHSLELYMNLHELNDIRRINAYLIEVNQRLQNNGYFVGRFESNQLRYNNYHKRYPFYVANIYYSIDFVWKRVVPKLPLMKKIFFFFTKGHNRALSLAEGLGRLYYCGFSVKAIREIDGYLYFVAKRDREPSTDTNPSYGLFFKMKRVGKNGKPIYVYKLRTMHPYSEYLQKFVHDNFSLKEGGKFENDFRITSWGKIARKLWIDELPMLINWIKRDLKLVGIRPLSFHYLSLYDKEYVKRRNKHKPGLVPPYYADLPKTLEEIQKSEIKYLDAYEKKKIIADIQYFFKVFYNIIFKKARSS